MSLTGLVTKRAVYKRKITSTFKCAFELAADPSSVSELKSYCDLVCAYLLDVKKYDDLINELVCAEHDGKDESEFTKDCASELDKQSDYAMAVNKQLAELKAKMCSVVPPKKVIENISNCELKLPEMKCDSFTGEGSNSLQYHDFFTQYNNVVGLRPNLSKSTKFSYLRSYLRGYALKLVQHLQVSDDNYDTALKLLSDEFLNKNSLIDDLLRKLFDLKPKFDSTFLATKIFISEVRCIISDLCAYDLDVIRETAANKIVSHVVFNKLPQVFKQEMVRKLGENFPSLADIFDNYVEIVRTLNLRQLPNPKVADKPDPVSKPTKSYYSTVSKAGAVKPSEKTEHSKMCKFCTCSGHSMVSCKRYNTHQQRKDRCVELKMCELCSSQKHATSDCRSRLDFKCNYCGSFQHISALCGKYLPSSIHNFCLNSTSDSGSTFLLPTITVNLNHGKHSAKINCLLDTGSQRSYVSSDVLKTLNLKEENKTSFKITTFLAEGEKTFTNASLSVQFMDQKQSFLIPFLVSDDCRLSYAVDGLHDAHDNISQKFNLTHRADSDTIQLDGLLGVDCLQFLSGFNVVQCLGGVAFKFRNHVIPYGNIDNFLTDSQLAKKYANDPSSCADASSKVDKSIINFVLNPSKSQFDPIGSVIQNSFVEDKIDSMFSLESIGVYEGESSQDLLKVEEFNKNIVFKDSQYQVKLPFNEKITDVKSNFHVSKAILGKVVENLKRNNLYDRYDAIFAQQLEDKIIEPINLDEIDINSYVFIPHRPVVKDDDQTTTKIRPVLNCSLKIDNTPSLNEASFPGINLINDLFKLLVRVRQGKYVAMGDIRKAFLMIGLRDEEDKNRFCLLWRDKNNKLIAYRYRTIVFGYVSSPFILGQVIKTHLQKYPQDECSGVLTNNLYVDNLFVTGDCPQRLRELCDTACERMADGGFELRSWVSNSPDLVEHFERGGKAVEHDGDTHKLLGYCYASSTDEISVAKFSPSDPNKPVTKRLVLSDISRLFEPLGLLNPILVRGKLLMRSIWESKVGWDDPLSKNLILEWGKLKTDLEKLPELKFDRLAYDENVTLYILCDSSKTSYGFVCYACSNGSKPNLVFSKVKIAPIKTRSLPTLELMAAFLALKCLPTILEAIGRKIRDVYIAVDAQIVLTWILTKTVKAKNICARNRVKDISEFRKNILDTYKVDCKFRYVPTELNSADLLTHGLTFRELCSKWDFWLHGPEFLRQSIVVWPENALGCLSEESKLLVCPSLVEPGGVSGDAAATQPVIPIDRYSDVNMLFKVTSLVLKYIFRLGKKAHSTDYFLNQSKLYWIKHEQNVHFVEEIKFLTSKSKSDKNVPRLVQNLNLFLDSDGILRSEGRLGNCEYLPEHVHNPIVIPKNSFLTVLLIRDAHARCKHLGSACTLGTLRRSGFWIPQGRTAVKAVIKQCVTCNKVNSHHFKYPKPNNFILDRVNFIKPFSHVGIDFTGNFLVKLGEKYVKMYIIVYSCINTRAIHLELLPNMTCQMFLLSFVRFSNMYGLASVVYTDNQSTFLQGMGIACNSLSSDDFTAHLQRCNIKYVRIPLYAAWIGSFWERMLRTLKNAIYKIVGRKRLEYFQFISLLSDIQNSINNRPLTYRDTDVTFEPLSPNSFLKLGDSKDFFISDVSGSELQRPSRKDLVRVLEKRDELFTSLKDQWYSEYLISLREASRDVYQGKWEGRIKKDDVVLIEAPIKTRPYWQLGRVIETLPGKDGRCRTVRVIRPDRSEGVYTIRQLYPLELSVTPTVLQEEPEVKEPEIRVRPQRAAALRCREVLENSI